MTLRERGRITDRPGNTNRLVRDTIPVTNISNQYCLGADDKEKTQFYTDSWHAFRKNARSLCNVPALLKFYTRFNAELDTICYVLPNVGPWQFINICTLMNLNKYKLVNKYVYDKAIVGLWKHDSQKHFWPDVLIIFPNLENLDKRSRWALNHYCGRCSPMIGTSLSALYSGVCWAEPPFAYWNEIKDKDPIVARILSIGVMPYAILSNSKTFSQVFSTMESLTHFTETMGYDSHMSFRNNESQFVMLKCDTDRIELNDAEQEVKTNTYCFIEKKDANTILASEIIEILIWGLNY